MRSGEYPAPWGGEVYSRSALKNNKAAAVGRPKKSARESGRYQSAGELRSPLSRDGFAFAPDSPMWACGPPTALSGRLPLLGI